MSITAVLSLFKRPETLIQQITALQNQTVPPEKIIIFKTTLEGVDMPTIPDELNKNISIIETKDNYGVWARFAIAFLATTDYICVIDDDTIPMKKWFENCLDTIKTYPGLLGTNGNIFEKGDKFRVTQVGWHSANDKTTEVDYVGHSWFFKREWLHYLWEYVPNISELMKSGEDMAFSAMLQKHNIKTYVPPHPNSDKDLWGSDPELGMKYGTDGNAISMGPTNFETFFKDLVNNKGFITINNRTKGGRRKTRKTRKHRI